MEPLSLGVVGTSRKPDEHRRALHPGHLERIDPALRRRIVLEEGYGERFGVSDDALAGLVAAVVPRAEILAGCDVVVLPKPEAEDLRAMRPGQVLWGWPHCVQNAEITQAAIDRRLTLIAWEAMQHWTADGAFELHVFHRNNELAGYCSVVHALRCRGRTGTFGRRLRGAVISFGATGRGAATALLALGVSDVTVLTHRPVPEVAAPIADARFVSYDTDDAGRPVLEGEEHASFAALLAEHDVIVNCVLQDPERPLVFVEHGDLPRFARGTLFVDVSSDAGMGFAWARPTSFAEPIVEVGDGAYHYGVDHSPSYLWDSATWEISAALMPHLPHVMAGPETWEADATLGRAIEIRDGVVRNPTILSFQGRAEAYPHRRLSGSGARSGTS